jgi:putative FmdB family regulatory protein
VFVLARITARVTGVSGVTGTHSGMEHAVTFGFFGEHVFNRGGDFPMPTYEYECEKCKKPFTVGQTLREYDLHEKPKCPRCGSRVVHQQVTSVHVQTGKKS